MKKEKEPKLAPIYPIWGVYTLLYSACNQVGSHCRKKSEKKQMRKLYSFILLILTLASFGQDIERKNRYLFWTYHQRNVNTNGVSLGIGSFGESMNSYTNGLKIELIGM